MLMSSVVSSLWFTFGLRRLRARPTARPEIPARVFDEATQPEPAGGVIFGSDCEIANTTRHYPFSTNPIIAHIPPLCFEAFI